MIAVVLPWVDFIPLVLSSVLSCLVFCLVLSCLLSCLVLSSVLSCLVFCLVLSSVLSCLVFCLVLSCLVSCLVQMLITPRCVFQSFLSVVLHLIALLFPRTFLVFPVSFHGTSTLGYVANSC